ncbi:MAG: UPF0182 family protein [Gemmatimonadota bacterium]|nr:MAG: UPF0182 family protein [Gemmatimonadota bacterium]
MKRSAAVLILVAGVLLVALFSFPWLVRVITDWYWFDALGFEVVFLKSLWTKFVLGVVIGVIVFAFFFANLRIAQRGLVPEPFVFSLSPNAAKLDVTQVLRRVTWPASIAMALMVGFSTTAGWLAVLRLLHSSPFGISDPVFGRDIAYYVFTLPVIEVAVGFVLFLVVLGLFMTVPIYLLRRDIVIARRRVMIERSAEVHLGILIALFFLATALNVFLVRIPSLLQSSGGPLFGASYTDLAIRVPLLHMAWIVAIVAAGFVLLGVKTRRLARNAVVAVIAYFLVSGVAGTLLPAAVQKFIVDPNELAKETPQLEHHISATRDAWGLDNVLIRDLSGEAALTLEDIQNNSGTIENVRLWDRGPLLQTFRQLQEIRTYYDFNSVDDDRYWIDGEYRQVLLSPRELNTASLPTRNFINERLTYTHGMGLTLSPVNQVSIEGLPVLFVKDLPPVSTVSLNVARPQVYFGELSNDYAFANTAQPEFDFPLGDSSAFTTYAGTGGIDISSFLRRFLLSARFRSLDVLLTEYITRDSRVLFYRNIRERAAKALPFLVWDGDPYMVITDAGELKWILDAYTSSGRYPYSQPIANGTNYMRNSVKVVIDAYDGDVKAYVVDTEDPIVRTYQSMFPGIFVPLDEMASDLRAHIRYPEDLFQVQTALYTTFHMDEPDIFYSREDQWQIPVSSRGEGSRDPFLRHIVMKLPGEAAEEYIIMTPFTPRQKDNLAAWMVARNDGANYGELVVYRFPRQSLVFGPSQIVNRMNQDTEISRQISLWDQRGSEVIRGSLLVIPIEESLIFVQAIYLRAEGGRIPELKRVIVAYQNRVVMEETLDRGLARLFGGAAALEAQQPALGEPDIMLESETTADMAELIRQASEHFDLAIEAQRAGDWARYGEEMSRVGELLRLLRDLGGGGDGL